MTVLVLGASGIIGQHMRLTVPEHVTPIWHRRTPDPIHEACDLSDWTEASVFLDEHNPDVIVNLVGECRVDLVEADPVRCDRINALFPGRLAEWCKKHDKRLIHVSSQAVFSGLEPPYGDEPSYCPANRYGWQKLYADKRVIENCPTATIVRPTFAIGVRPLPHVGRQNPAEQMISGPTRQVDNRYFSPGFASDVARGIWNVVKYGTAQDRIIHLGLPKRVSRYDIAQALGAQAEPAKHEDFPGIAPRPLDTTYADGSTRTLTTWAEGIEEIKHDWRSRLAGDELYLARQIAIFLGLNQGEAYARLRRGFLAAHHDVAADFRRANPKSDEELLEWYRNTDAYIWELTAYHADERWNYKGMCKGVIDRLLTESRKHVLCLGDGVGDLTLAMRHAGLEAVYHDLGGSKTAAFAAFRYWAETGEQQPYHLTGGWQPALAGPWDCITSYDFLEHVTDVEAWCREIHAALAPGGLFFAQNAFNCGSGAEGSIPCHLARNDRYEKDWDPLMASIGMKQLSSNWYQKAV